LPFATATAPFGLDSAACWRIQQGNTLSILELLAPTRRAKEVGVMETTSLDAAPKGLLHIINSTSVAVVTGGSPLRGQGTRYSSPLGQYLLQRGQHVPGGAQMRTVAGRGQ
jgi:hypothetical protein